MRKHPAKTSKPQAAAQEPVQVDYPQEGEKVTGASYTFRIRAPQAAGSVEVSLNKGPWLTCRHDGDYWWYDWASVAPGTYKLRARAQGNGNGNGKAKPKQTLLRRFLVSA